ncbi:hypothetical protein [Tautonia marina]|uniref:hypothetical protein n=1 Tax=Tautonia marina TaxID=2653855 RepID=UPI001260863D|nr:hypothetical protein [Tautonia marina]
MLIENSHQINAFHLNINEVASSASKNAGSLPLNLALPRNAVAGDFVGNSRPPGNWLCLEIGSPSI